MQYRCFFSNSTVQYCLLYGAKNFAALHTAAEIAVELGNGKQPKADATLNNGLKDVPARLLTPIEVNKENIDATVIKDGFHNKSEL